MVPMFCPHCKHLPKKLPMTLAVHIYCQGTLSDKCSEMSVAAPGEDQAVQLWNLKVGAENYGKAGK